MKEFCTGLLEGKKEPETGLGRGAIKLVRMLIGLDSRTDGRKPFVLINYDIDIKEILVSEDGALQSIIGWDVITVPQSLGNATTQAGSLTTGAQ